MRNWEGRGNKNYVLFCVVSVVNCGAPVLQTHAGKFKRVQKSHLKWTSKFILFFKMFLILRYNACGKVYNCTDLKHTARLIFISVSVTQKDVTHKPFAALQKPPYCVLPVSTPRHTHCPEFSPHRVVLPGFKLRINGLIQYRLFRVGLALLNLMSVRFTRVTA